MKIKIIIKKNKNQKIFNNIGTWNVRTSNNEGNLDLLLKNMKSFNIKILAVSETHWNNSVEDTFQQNGCHHPFSIKMSKCHHPFS